MVLIMLTVAGVLAYKYRVHKREGKRLRRLVERDNVRRREEERLRRLVERDNVRRREEEELRQREEEERRRVSEHDNVHRSSITKPTRVILASLILGMYGRAQNKPHHTQFWELHHYKLVPLDEILTEEEMKRCQHYLLKEKRYKYFGVLKKCTSRASPEAPNWVVAVRGTVKMVGSRALQDIVNDLKIVIENLHSSSTVKLLEIVVSRLVKDLGSRQVTVTGHSLGASMATLVTRNLALEGVAIESHFFNPPFATFAALGWKWLLCFFCGLTEGGMVERTLATFAACLSVGVNLLSAGGRSMKKQVSQYIALSKWSPHLYLNENDPVCRLYIPYFAGVSTEKARLLEKICKFYSWGTRLLKFVSRDSVRHQTFHLMPRAISYISKRHRSKPFSAHSLENWIWQDEPLEIKESNLATLFEMPS